MKKEQYIDFWESQIPPSKLVIKTDFDFDKTPVWNLSKYKWRLITWMTFFLVINITASIVNFWVPAIFVTKRYYELGFVFGIIIFRVIFDVIFSKFFILAIDNMGADIKRSAINILIKADPIHHTTKSSGEVISKIARAGDSVFQWLDNMMVTPIKFGVSFVFVVTGALAVDLRLGLIFLIVLPITLFLNSYLTLMNNKHLLGRSMTIEDSTSQTMVDILTQFGIIRSTFSTDIMNDKYNSLLSKATYYNALRWRVWQILILTVNVVTYLIIGGVLWYLFPSLDLSSPLLIGVIISLFGFLNDIWSVGLSIKDCLEAHQKINNLFIFIRGFGKQSIGL
jgi:ABC-type multidrug transport system fused ATPase/permease subunit